MNRIGVSHRLISFATRYINPYTLKCGQKMILQFTPSRPFSEEITKQDQFVFQKLTPDPQNAKKMPIPKDAFSPGISQEQSAGGTNIVRSPMRDSDDYFDETDPLHMDMLEISSHTHEATLIWLLGAGDAHEKSRPIFEVLSAGLSGFRVVVPNPPRIPITALHDRMERAWYDIEKPQYSEDVDDYDDFKGMTKSTRRLHELVHEELHKLEESLTATNTPLPSWFKNQKEQAASRLFVGGFAQGGALALYSSIRFPQTIGGIISFAGYFPFLAPTIKMANKNSGPTAGKKQTAASSTSQTSEQTPLPSETQAQPQAQVQAQAPQRAPGLDTPVLVVHGKEDEAIPYKVALPRYAQALKPPLSMSMRLIEGRDLGHNFGPQQMDAMREWLLAKLRHNKDQPPTKPKSV